MACRCFKVYEADGGVLLILKAIICKSRIHAFGLVQTHTHGKVCHPGCWSGNATRATWKTRMPGLTSSLSASFQTHMFGEDEL